MAVKGEDRLPQGNQDEEVLVSLVLMSFLLFDSLRTSQL